MQRLFSVNCLYFLNKKWKTIHFWHSFSTYWMLLIFQNINKDKRTRSINLVKYVATRSSSGRYFNDKAQKFIAAIQRNGLISTKKMFFFPLPISNPKIPRIRARKMGKPMNEVKFEWVIKFYWFSHSLYLPCFMEKVIYWFNEIADNTNESCFFPFHWIRY